MNTYQARMIALKQRQKAGTEALMLAEKQVKTYMRTSLKSAASGGRFQFEEKISASGTNTDALKKKFPKLDRYILYGMFLDSLQTVLRNHGFRVSAEDEGYKHLLTVSF